MKVVIYTDGAADPNPGKMGVAAVLTFQNDDGKVEKELAVSKCFEHGTNQQAEILAAVIGLSSLKTGYYPITVISDSQYLVKTMNREFSRRTNHPYWQALDRVISTKGLQVSWQWVRGHNGDEYNELAHEHANIAMNFTPESVGTWL